MERMHIRIVQGLQKAREPIYSWAGGYQGSMTAAAGEYDSKSTPETPVTYRRP
ncbi:hypothetical protein J6590_012212 [Homalodisca vitripennis]|nr:hypothetical protein J6590_012212 [Homalodisca vitripennis]